MITDTKGTILYANPAFEKSTGYTRAEAIGQNPRVLKSGKQGDEFYRAMWETLERGEVWHGHFINRHKNGALYEEDAAISPVRDVAGKIVSYAAVKRDVTREVQLERQLLEAQKMESVGQLAGGVAHDFNNMLAATMMNFSLLQMDKTLKPEARETISELIKEAEQGSQPDPTIAPVQPAIRHGSEVAGFERSGHQPAQNAVPADWRAIGGEVCPPGGLPRWRAMRG